MLSTGKYEFKPIVVEAVRTTRSNIGEVAEWMGAADFWATANRFYIKKTDIFTTKWEGRFGEWVYLGPDKEFHLISVESFRALFNPEGINNEEFDFNEAAIKGEPFWFPPYDR